LGEEESGKIKKNNKITIKQLKNEKRKKETELL